jgi:hypothetical protein
VGVRTRTEIGWRSLQNRPPPKAQIALAGCPGAKERLGGRAVLALCRGRCAMSRAARLKSAATCLSAGSHPPAAQSVTGRGCEKPNRKPTTMTIERPMFPPRADKHCQIMRRLSRGPPLRTHQSSQFQRHRRAALTQVNRRTGHRGSFNALLPSQGKRAFPQRGKIAN